MYRVSTTAQAGSTSQRYRGGCDLVGMNWSFRAHGDDRMPSGLQSGQESFQQRLLLPWAGGRLVSEHRSGLSLRGKLD